MDCSDAGVTEANRWMRFAYREFVTPGMLMLVLGIGSGLIILMTFIGPFGIRYTLSWNGRLALCVTAGALCLLICYPAAALTLFLCRFRTGAVAALALAAYALIMAVPCGAIAYGVYGVFHGAPLASGELPITYLVCAGLILGATALVQFVLYLRVSGRQIPAANTATPSTGAATPDPGPETGNRARQTRVTPAGGSIKPASGAPATDRVRPGAPGADAAVPGGKAAPNVPVKPPSASFLDRLPAHLGSDVVYLKVSGHYLEVVTTRGTSVILQRLMDAVRELGGHGMQIHRSYWVAHRHIRYVVRRERRTLLHLTGDYEVPVSRTYLPEVRRLKPQMPLRHRAAHRPEQQENP